MTLALRYAARSHVGLLRTGNEDSGFAGPRLLAVADGMGGHAAGEVASAIAIGALAVLDEDAPGADLLDALRTAAVAANDSLRHMVEGNTSLAGMGTTLTALLFTAGRLGMLHIGDSRCYLLRDGALHQITHDDTLVQTLVDEGRISAEEASVHPQRSLITRALDGREGVDFDLSVREVRAGDRYLLCTDGLTGPVGRLSTLQDGLALPAPRDAVDRLVELALRGGGPDNISVVVADVVDGEPAGEPIVVGAAAESPQALPAHLADSPAARAAASAVASRAAATSRGRGASRAESDAPASGAVGSQGGPPAAELLTGSGRGTRGSGAPGSAATVAMSVPVPSGSAPGQVPVELEPERPDHRHGRGRRRLTVLLLVVGLLALGAGGGWAYLRSQWFVGTDGNHVLVYRGISGSVAGIHLAAVSQQTDLSPTSLSELDRQAVERGIPATGPADARRLVAALRDRVASACDATTGACPGTPTPGATSPSTPTPGATSPGTPTPSSSGDTG